MPGLEINKAGIDAIVKAVNTYAQLGDIVFDHITGFTNFGENEDANIAQYGLIKGKPFPQAMAPNLVEVSIGMRLHQRFIKVQEARLQLRAYKDNGTTLTLMWGNGTIAGRYIIQGMNTTIVESDGHGNVFCVDIGVTLLEVPAENLLTEKQADAYKKAFGVGDFTTPIAQPPFVEPSPLEKFLMQLQKAMRYAALIDALAYGGRFPVYLGSSLGQIIQNAKANSILMGQQFATYGALWDIPDITDDITNVTDSLTILAGINPLTDPLLFADANKAFQQFNRVLCF